MLIVKHAEVISLKIFFLVEHFILMQMTRGIDQPDCAAGPLAGSEDCRWVAALLCIGKRSGHTPSPSGQGGDLRGKGPTGSPPNRPTVLRETGRFVIRSSVSGLPALFAFRDALPAIRT
jgi:hypothetical protein